MFSKNAINFNQNLLNIFWNFLKLFLWHFPEFLRKFTWNFLNILLIFYKYIISLQFLQNFPKKFSGKCKIYFDFSQNFLYFFKLPNLPQNFHKIFENFFNASKGVDDLSAALHARYCRKNLWAVHCRAAEKALPGTVCFEHQTVWVPH